MKTMLICGLLALAMAPAGFCQEQAQDSASIIKEALSAAPSSIADHATVMDWNNKVLREGNNGWTCMPSPPDASGTMPMCLDAQWLKWAQAWAAKTTPEATGIGFAYMLQGDAGGSNTDPFATEPTADNEWIEKGGPHIMVIAPSMSDLEGLPTDPDNGGPWVMWKGTPYAHVMVPTPGLSD